MLSVAGLAEARSFMSHIHLLWDVPIFWWHAWGTVVRPLIEDLGIFGLLFGLCAFGIRYLEHRWKKRSHADAYVGSKEYLHDSVLTPLITCIVLFVVLGFALAPYKVHEKDQKQIGENEGLKIEVQDLRKTLDSKAQNLDISDPVFVNLIYMMSAFRVYRGMVDGLKKPTPCEVRLTAPDESGAIARTVAAFSIETSNCATFGPMLGTDNPDEERETVTGMIPETIVFHARRDDKAANELYVRLSNYLPLKRSFDVPSKSPQNFVWLQFGPMVKWNSERLTKARGSVQ